jgi:hypothetical protein
MAKCFGEGDIGACAMMVLGVIPWGKILKAGKIVKALENAVSAVRSFLKQQEWAKGLLAKARGLFSKCNSFTPETQVVMADGKRKPIAAVRVGDKVLATDPETGRSEAKTVANLIIGKGKKNLVEITVDTDGAAGPATGKVTATDGHPFWLPDKGVWVKADQLQEGSWLQTSAGTQVQVKALRKWTAYERVYNLTVTDIHTYFVVAGAQPILNHNCGEGGYDLRDKDPMSIVPDNASIRELTPHPNGGSQYGLEYKWTNEAGQTVRMRIHGPDGTAPAGSNSAMGETYRVQIGARYQDEAGNLYHKNVHKEASPYYDPSAANKTHIPWPSQFPGL